jgi:glycosidase
MTLEEQFKALVEAAHCLGIKVVTEFIFRTSSKDSPIAITHPE